MAVSYVDVFLIAATILLLLLFDLLSGWISRRQRRLPAKIFLGFLTAGFALSALFTAGLFFNVIHFGEKPGREQITAAHAIRRTGRLGEAYERSGLDADREIWRTSKEASLLQLSLLSEAGDDEGLYFLTRRLLGLPEEVTYLEEDTVLSPAYAFSDQELLQIRQSYGMARLRLNLPTAALSPAAQIARDPAAAGIRLPEGPVYNAPQIPPEFVSFKDDPLLSEAELFPGPEEAGLRAYGLSPGELSPSGEASAAALIRQKRADIVEAIDRRYAGDYPEVRSVSTRSVSSKEDGYPGSLSAGLKQALSREQYADAYLLAETEYDKNPTDENAVLLIDLLIRLIEDGDVPDSMLDADLQNVQESARQLRQKLDAAADEAEREQLKTLLHAELLELRLELTERAILLLDLQTKKSGDRQGLLGLERTKLYFLRDEFTAAKNALFAQTARAGSLSDNSPVKPVLSELDKTRPEDHEAIDRLVGDLIAAQSPHVPLPPDTEEELVDRLASSVKYDRVSVRIVDVDASAYPNVSAVASIAGFAGQQEVDALFTRENFDLLDTQFPVDDFQVTRLGETEQTEVVLVMDVSGSMEGDPLRQAQAAALRLIDIAASAGQNLGLVAYSSGAVTLAGPAASPEQQREAIRGLSADNGTNIMSGLREALSIFSYRGNTPYIILMTDGAANEGEELRGEVMAAVRDNNVMVFAVGIGSGADYAYLEALAVESEGESIRTENEKDLERIYERFSGLIRNSYRFDWTVTAAADLPDREALIRFRGFGESDKMPYRVGLARQPKKQDGTVIKDGLIISSVTPREVGVKTAAAGFDIEFTGSGFSDWMEVQIGDEVFTTDEVANEQADDSFVVQARITEGVGAYEIIVRDAYGRTVHIEDPLQVYTAVNAKKVLLGQNVLTGKLISSHHSAQDADDTPPTVRISGSAVMNGFIRFEEGIVAGHELDADTFASRWNDAAKTGVLNLGDDGELTGRSRVYIEYPKGSAFTDFCSRLLLEADCVEINPEGGQIDIAVKEGEAKLELTDYAAGLNKELAIRVPILGEIKFASMELKPDRLVMTVDGTDLDSFADLIGQFSGTKRDVKKKSGPKPSDRFYAEAKGTLGFTPNGAGFSLSGEIDLERMRTRKLSNPLPENAYFFNRFEFKLGNLDEDFEFLKLGVEVRPKVINNLLDAHNQDFWLRGGISTYLWLPNALEVGARFDPGFPVGKVFYFNDFALNIEGAARLITHFYPDSRIVKKLLSTGAGVVNPEEAADPDNLEMALKLTAKADISLAASLGQPQVTKKLKLDDLLNLGEAEISGRFRFLPSFKFTFETEATLLESAETKLKFEIDPPDVTLDAGLTLDINLLLARLIGEAAMKSKISFSDAFAFYMELFLNGRMSSSLTRDYNGEVYTKIGFDKYLYLIGAGNGEGFRVWYDPDGRLFRRIRFESYRVPLGS